MVDTSHTNSPRPRRRKRQPTMIDHSVPSPCVGICWLEEKTGYCQGCWRTGDEIRDWIIMSREQKQAVLDQIERRKT